MMNFYTLQLLLLWSVIVLQTAPMATSLARVVVTTPSKNNNHNNNEEDKNNIYYDSYKPHLKTTIARSVAKGERRANHRSSSGSRVLCPTCHRPPTICVCAALPVERIALESTKVLILQHPREFRRKTISTTPLLPLVLQDCIIQVGYHFDPRNGDENNWKQLPWMSEILAKGQKPLLLFPGPDALTIDKGYYATTINTKNNEINNTNGHPDGIIHHHCCDTTTTNKNTTTTIKNGGMVVVAAEDSGGGCGESTNTKTNDFNLLIVLDGTWSQASNMARDSPALVQACQKIQFTTPGNSIYDGTYVRGWVMIVAWIF
jgi:DTW domain-containing protein YfiP